MLEKALGLAKNGRPKATPFVKAWEHHPIGYPRLSEHIACKPESGIYRRFDGLNARRVLYLQAELCVLEKKLHLIERQDKKGSKGKRAEYAIDYQCMLEEADGTQSKQIELIGNMQEKLNQYSKDAAIIQNVDTGMTRNLDKALIQLSILHKLKAPDRFDLYNIQEFLESEEMGPNHMNGVDVRTWGTTTDADNHPPDIIAVHPRNIEDKFSRVVSERAIYLFKCGLGLFTKGNRHLGPKVYYDTTVAKVTLWVSSMIAAMLPIASILVLIQLDSLKAKLWTIAAFNVGMSFCLTFFANAKRAEVFAVTSAFAAVLVVFVSTDRGSPST